MSFDHEQFESTDPNQLVMREINPNQLMIQEVEDSAESCCDGDRIKFIAAEALRQTIEFVPSDCIES